MVTNTAKPTRGLGELLAVILTLAVIGGTIMAIFGYEAARSKERGAIDLAARPISTWSRTEIRVKRGELVRLRIVNEDCVIHGFAIPELDIDEIIIQPGHNHIVEFTPEYEGEYIYKCIVQCDRELHDFMTGKLIVEK